MNSMTRKYPDPPNGPPFWSMVMNEQRVLVATLLPESDKDQELIANSVALHQARRLGAANSSGTLRSDRERMVKGIMGALAEEWFLWLLRHFEQQITRPDGAVVEFASLAPVVEDGEFDQIDVLVTKTYFSKAGRQESKQSIEVRSSFPFLPLDRVLFRDFDVLGPYSNERKSGESAKDLYARVLIDLDQQSKETLHVHKVGRDGAFSKQVIDYSATATKILSENVFDQEFRLIAPFRVALVGGATAAMLADDSLSYNGTMRSATFGGSGVFRKMKLYNALDAPSLLRVILGHVGDAHLVGR